MTYATPSQGGTASTLFINGSWEPAESGAVRQIRNPADGELAATVSEAGREDAGRAIAAARAAFDSGVWSSVPAPERGSFLLRVGAELRERREKFARAESLVSSVHELVGEVPDPLTPDGYFPAISATREWLELLQAVGHRLRRDERRP